MNDQALKKEIRGLLEDRNAVLLAHNYQRDEVQEIADHTGDSLHRKGQCSCRATMPDAPWPT